MSGLNAIRIHDQDAAGYDALVASYGSHAHDVLSGLCYEYMGTGDKLLDLGIGTGLSSVPFARTGLQVTGVDGSAEMLQVCRRRGIATDLLCLDLLDGPLPFPADEPLRARALLCPSPAAHICSFPAQSAVLFGARL